MAACLILQRFLDHLNRVRAVALPAHANPSPAVQSHLLAAALPASTAATTPQQMSAAGAHMARTMHMQLLGRITGGAGGAWARAQAQLPPLHAVLPRDDPYVMLPPLPPKA